MFTVEMNPDGTFNLIDSSGNIEVTGSSQEIRSFIDELIQELEGLRDHGIE